ncbi:hypothetical protein QFZ87_001092 [Bacillus sp. SLBN-46]|nr:hypothetical protein [Bacillus sp. SLBN-46]
MGWQGGLRIKVKTVIKSNGQKPDGNEGKNRNGVFISIFLERRSKK